MTCNHKHEPMLDQSTFSDEEISEHSSALANRIASYCMEHRIPIELAMMLLTEIAVTMVIVAAEKPALPEAGGSA